MSSQRTDPTEDAKGNAIVQQIIGAARRVVAANPGSSPQLQGVEALRVHLLEYDRWVGRDPVEEPEPQREVET